MTSVIRVPCKRLQSVNGVSGGKGAPPTSRRGIGKSAVCNPLRVGLRIGQKTFVIYSGNAAGKQGNRRMSVQPLMIGGGQLVC